LKFLLQLLTASRTFDSGIFTMLVARSTSYPLLARMSRA